MAVLYRTYRPQKFSEVVGQRPIVKTLQNAVRQGVVAHAYLFTGSRGVGKTSLARILAKAVNCGSAADGDACLTCSLCTQLADGSSLDIVEIDAASNTGVENVRELIEHVQFRPTQAKFKVFIIDEVHMLSKAAFNALLKTLEEPPSHVIFILATTEIHKVPVTIVSRAQRFDFARIDQTDLKKHLEYVTEKEGLQVSGEVLDLVVQKSEGGLRDALSLLEKIVSLGENVAFDEVLLLLGMTTVEMSQELYGLIHTKDTSKLPAFFDRLFSRGVDPILFNKDFLEYLRQLLVAKVSGVSVSTALSEKQGAQFTADVAGSSVQALMFVIRLFLRSLKDAAMSPSVDLPMLLAAVEAALGSEVSTKSTQAAAPQVMKPATPPVSVATFTSVAMPEPVAVKAAIPAPVFTEPGTNSGSFDEISFGEFQELWPVIIGKLKVINSPLATLVKSSPLVGVERGVVRLAVQYLFHKEHLESTKIFQLITGVIQTTAGKRLGLEIVLVKPEEKAANLVQAVDDALKVFGGEVV